MLKIEIYCFKILQMQVPKLDVEHRGTSRGTCQGLIPTCARSPTWVTLAWMRTWCPTSSGTLWGRHFVDGKERKSEEGRGRKEKPDDFYGFLLRHHFFCALAGTNCRGSWRDWPGTQPNSRQLTQGRQHPSSSARQAAWQNWLIWCDLMFPMANAALSSWCFSIFFPASLTLLPWDFEYTDHLIHYMHTKMFWTIRMLFWFIVKLWWYDCFAIGCATSCHFLPYIAVPWCGIRNTDPQLKIKLQRLETQKRAALDSEAGHVPSTWHGQSLVMIHVRWWLMMFDLFQWCFRG